MQSSDKKIIKGVGILTVVFIVIYISLSMYLKNAHSEPVDNPSATQLITEQVITLCETLLQSYLLPLYLLLTALLILKWGVKRIMQK